ncbi:MAG TPA: TssN family type VI secretion system protein [Panacibacter sp.]|nr:TssN family type VI secretion system protein [Panacibacter sp.]
MIVLVKYFWMYFGVLLTCSIALAVMVKPFAESFAASGKKPFVYGGFSSVIASLVAYCTKWVSDNLFTVFWFLAGIFLFFGIIHLAFVHKKYFDSRNQDKTKALLGEIIFGLSIVLFTIVIFSTLKFFINPAERDFLFYPMVMSGLSFFVPMLFLQTFNAAYNIPAAVFKTWQYPLNEIELPDEDPREKIIVMGFEIAKKVTDKRKTFFRAKAPESMKLGDLYYHFINDYNEVQSETPIELAGNEDLETHEWWFRIKPKWYQFQRILDPDISVRENGIKENSVIICERIENPL